MAAELKPTVSVAESFAKLDIRVGRVIEVNLENSTNSPTYKMLIDFGKFGTRVSYGRFTQHPIGEVKQRLVLGVLNFAPKEMDGVMSQVLIPQVSRLVNSLV